MKKPKIKRRYIIIAVILLVLAALAGVFSRPIRSVIAMAGMKAVGTKEVMPGIYSVSNGFVNLYLLEVGEKYIVFDAGVNAATTKKELDNLQIDAKDVVAVFLTHTDGDHVGSLSLFDDAEIYTAESNKTFIEEEPGRSRAFINAGMAYKTMADGETININGSDIQCIFTPGHTNGSACFLADGKYLFAGDNLSLKGGKISLFNSVFNMDDAEQQRSIAKILQIEGIETIFTMHYGYTTEYNR